MTPGVNRLSALGLSFPSSSRAVYTPLAVLPPNYIFDVQPMPTTPRDSAVPRLRWDLVVRVRREIEAGIYDQPEKWETALSRLQAEIERQAYREDEQIV
jgi:hypothetical protein